MTRLPVARPGVRRDAAGTLVRGLQDRRGAAAIEFALIFPMLFVLIIAAGEGLQAYIAQRQVSHIAATMADITAQSRVVTISQVDDILTASTSMIHPFPTTSLQQRVASVSANGSGTVSTDWVQNRGWLGSGNPGIPNGYLAANESVVVAEVAYDYRPTFGLFMPESIRITRQAYSRPRLSPKVERTT
ncbi:MAG: pilus assembly protein [Phenylobacterium sp.]|uniref:TadE/TadG family type IV pilus assembly protein n=1 Tax=Phenylobacterium sp. TaxID=1871053 RepID=UPI001A414B0D|nr:TadE/TadG family type IV pilus assembly protein [Phenylobacterium sp.]MBL8770244.1 pilus assembly protein [Phenylobacterium sp.]